MGRVSRLSEAAAQIRAGSRMLVREVKHPLPEPVLHDPDDLAQAVSLLEEDLEAGRLDRAEAALDRALAPILAGPGHEVGRVPTPGVWLLLVGLAALVAATLLLLPVV